jgi:hypothetical protein
MNSVVLWFLWSKHRSGSLRLSERQLGRKLEASVVLGRYVGEGRTRRAAGHCLSSGRGKPATIRRAVMYAGPERVGEMSCP